MEQTSTDTLIIGAGPVGLTLAIDLARRGLRVRIIDREPSANRASKAKTIQPRALEVLDDLGVIDAIREVGVTAIPMRFHNPDGTVTDRPSMSVRAADAFSSPYPDPLWIAQFDVESILRTRLESLGVLVEFGTEATSLAQDDHAVTAGLEGPMGSETVRATFAVAADGGKSATRRLIGLPLVGRTYDDQRWYLGDVTAPGLDRAYMHVWTSDEGMLGLTPLPGSDLWQFQAPIPAHAQPVEPSLESYQALFDDRVGAGRVTLDSATWLLVYRVNVRMVERYRNGRILLAGDAAHVHSPAGGQGMNTGIQDAYNLGWKIAAVIAGAGDALLDTYGEERIPVARAVLADSTRKMQSTLGNAGARTDEGLSRALGSIADDITTGLPIGYPDSSLTLELPLPRTVPVRPGDRAPDARGLRGAGFDGSLFDVLRGPQWTLLAFTRKDAAPGLAALADNGLHVHVMGDDITDADGQLAENYQPDDDELILIRPDGYVAARSPLHRLPALLDYLATVRP